MSWKIKSIDLFIRLLSKEKVCSYEKEHTISNVNYTVFCKKDVYKKHEAEIAKAKEHLRNTGRLSFEL